MVATLEKLTIGFEIPEEHKDKWVLCASKKHGFAYNSLLFWGKNDCGYKPNINDCQLYTEEEVMQRANKQNIPMKLTDLINNFAVHVEHADCLLGKAEREYLKV